MATFVSPIGVFETSHVINALFGLIAVVGAFRLGHQLAGPVAGFLSALFLVLTPRFYGDTFNNSVDIAMAALTVFFLYYLVQSLNFLPHLPGRLILRIGLTLGLALAVRVGAVILGICLCVSFGVWLFRRLVVGPSILQPTGAFRSALIGVLSASLRIFAIAYVVMLVLWPAALLRPVVQPLKALLFASRFPYPIDIFFDGKTISNQHLPWYYTVKWFLITLPEFYFFALPVGVLLVILFTVRSARQPAHWDYQLVCGVSILGLLAFLLLAYTTLAKPAEYDGIRHYLFLLPPLAVLAGISVASLLARTRSSVTKGAILTAIAASLLLTAVDMVQLHPYQYIFFNRLVAGGIAEGARLYETDYWGASYKEGAEWLVKEYGSYKENRLLTVASCLYSLSTSYFLPPDRFEYIGSFHDGQRIMGDKKPDLFLAVTRWDCHKKLSGPVLKTVTRKGVPLLYVMKTSNQPLRTNSTPADLQ